jgi:ABC-type transporter MlaC component
MHNRAFISFAHKYEAFNKITMSSLAEMATDYFTMKEDIKEASAALKEQRKAFKALQQPLLDALRQTETQTVEVEAGTLTIESTLRDS